MDTFIDLYIHSPSMSPKSIIQEIKAFSNQKNSWNFNTQASNSYSKAIGEPACSVDYIVKNKTFAALSVANSSRRKGVYVANIVPRQKSSFSISEYNKIANQFFSEFSNYCKRKKIDISFEKKGENISLKDIIPGSRTRSFFERYLNMHPRSYHPLDIERLDIFICALSRYRSRIDLNLLERYLIEILNWTKKDAKWCTSRINTGVAVLDVRKKF